MSNNTLNRQENEARMWTAKEISNAEEKKRKKEQKLQQKAIASNIFWENYKHPLWQRKRLSIMERDKFKCQSCGDEDKTLNVHHKTPYRIGIKPWDYENDELITLCSECHKSISEIIQTCKSILMNISWNVESAEETQKILEQIDGMNISQLNSVLKIIKEAKEL